MLSDLYDYMLNVLDKTEKGPIVEVDEYDKKQIYQTTN